MSATWPGETQTGFLPLFVLIFVFLLLTSQTAAAFTLQIGTDEPGSFSYFAAKTICSSMKKIDNTVNCKPIPAALPTDTLTNLQVGSLDLALVNSKTIYDAFNSLGLFQYITINYDDLRLLVPFYRSPVTLLVRSNAEILKLDDLVGKRVNGGAHNSIENRIFKEIMAAKNWHKGDFLLYQNLPKSNAQDYLALKSGTVQAMLHVGMHPDDRIRQLLADDKIGLLSLNDAELQNLIDKRAGFCASEINREIYPGPGINTKTLGMETLLIATADTDATTVKQVLNALNETKKQVQVAHPAFLQHKVDMTTLDNSYLRPHPASRLYYQSTLP